MAEEFKPPPLDSWEGPAEQKSLDKDVKPKANRTPPPGLGHAAYRGFVSTMQDLDQLASNVMGIAAKIPNTPNFKSASVSMQADANRRKTELEADTAKGGSPQTGPEKLAEGVVGSIGSAVPYLATEGPLGAAAVGALQNTHRGAGAAIKEGAKAALFTKAAGVVGKNVDAATASIAQKAPTLAKSVPDVVSRGARGAATAALLAPPGQTGKQAVLGAVAGASQREPQSANEIRAARLQAATGKTGENAWESYRVIGPRLEETAKLTGKNPQNVPELLENVKQTNQRLNNEFEGYLGPIQNQTVFAQSVADAIRNKIYEVERNGNTKEEKATGDAMETRAREFEKGFTLRELDGLRKIYFERLKGQSSETLKARGSGDIRADRAAEEAIKDLEYGLVDQQAQAAGKPAGYIREQLKTQQAHLIKIQDALLKRKDALSEKEGIEKGTPVMQKADATLALHPGGGAVGSLHGIWKKIWGDPDSFKEANKRVANSFPVKTSTPNNRVNAVVASAKADDGKDKTASPQKTTVTMRAPDGSTKDIPMAEVNHWKAKGAQVVQ